MGGRVLDPARIDGGDHARVHARGLDEAARHDPARTLRRERRARRDDEANRRAVPRTRA